jgi:beta-lactam-binding protein with PASTA domain/predicted Ser/Thr protein kinase
MSPQAPKVFNGRYELHRRLGRGGMAEVFLARDQLLDRPVAIKVLFPEFATDPAFVERFRREATAAANLNHPNIVGVYDWGEAEGTYFIVMEFVDGQSLSQILRAEGPFHPDAVADIGSDMAAALGFAHRNGVVHRDVKPGNVLVDTHRQVKVADFGIARAITAATDDNLTQAGTVMGTATYFSPEQARGDAVDPRSDIYSLGCVLYELVVGRPPFSGDSPVGIAYKQVHEAPVPPRQINPSIPKALEAIILKCLAKNPVNRYPSAEDLRSDLRRFREGNRILAEPVMPPPRGPDPGATGVLAATAAVPAAGGGGRTRIHAAYVEEYDDEPRRNSGGFLAVLVILLLLLAGMLFLLARTLGIGDDDGGVATREVPRVTGETLDEAIITLEGSGFEVESTIEANDEFDEGIVFDQDPGFGEKVPVNSTINLKVSGGTEALPVPDVVGSSQEEATETLEGAGFRVLPQSEENDDVPLGEVISQSPGGGEEAPADSQVTIVVSSGKGQSPVPDVSGRTVADASNLIGQAGFKVTQSEAPSATVPEGRVIRTDPAAGTPIDKNSTVELVVSSGAEEVDVPGVVGLSQANATNVLTTQGFKVNVEEKETANPTQVGKVIEQDPVNGTAPQGSEVTIVVGVEPGGDLPDLGPN